MTQEFLLQLLVTVAAGGGIYAGIRYDLGRLHEKAEAAVKAAGRAHERIDGHLENHHAGV